MYNKVEVMKTIRKDCERGASYTVAIRRAGIRSPQTIENWRKKRPLLDRYFEKVIRGIDKFRNAAIEDKFFDRLLTGEAHSSEYMFYFMNRCPERWQDKRALVNLDQSHHTHFTTVKQIIENANRNKERADSVSESLDGPREMA